MCCWEGGIYLNVFISSTRAYPISLTPCSLDPKIEIQSRWRKAECPTWLDREHLNPLEYSEACAILSSSCTRPSWKNMTGVYLKMWVMMFYVPWRFAKVIARWMFLMILIYVFFCQYRFTVWSLKDAFWNGHFALGNTLEDKSCHPWLWSFISTKQCVRTSGLKRY